MPTEPRADEPAPPSPGGLRGRFAAPGSFARSVLTLMTGTTLASVIPVAISPVLSRLYSPADFGLFAIYVSIAGLLSVAATGRYEMAIVLPAEDGDAFELLTLSLVLAGAVTAVSLVAVVAFHSSLLAVLHAPALSAWLWLLPLGVLLMGFAQALTNWLNRKRSYSRIAQGRILQAVATAVLAVALARTALGAGSLILSAIVGQALATVFLALAAWSGLRGSGLRATTRGMRSQAARYRDFPRINALHALVDNLNSTATVLLLSHYFSTVVVGHYSMVMRVLTAPVALIGTAITQVFYQRAADHHNRGGELAGLIRSLLLRSLWIAVPATAALLLGAPTLFSIAFGAKWAAAGGYARLLSPYMFFYFLAAPLAFVPFVLDRQGQSFLLSVTGNLLFLACIAVGGRMGAPEIGFGALSVVQSAYFVVYIGWILRIASRPKQVPA
jgi:O-antigen/teichoic acid export membrane protein